MQNKIISDLLNMRDSKFAQFNANLMPTINSQKVIGVKTPYLKKYAKTISNPDELLQKTPHEYFEENQIHAFLLSDIKDFKKCVNMVDAFLPYIDNWATGDQLIPKVFAKNTDKLLPWIKKWIKSKHTFTVRFAIGLLMRFYLGDAFDKKYANMVTGIKTDKYYVNMIRAWYFATALNKNWDLIIEIIESKKLDKWTHNKTIQNQSNHFASQINKKNI